jgi:hypothetical protein
MDMQDAKEESEVLSLIHRGVARSSLDSET